MSAQHRFEAQPPHFNVAHRKFGGSIPACDLTVVIPAHNEERRLPKSLPQLFTELDQWGLDYNVLVVDDGSRDATARVAQEFGPLCSVISLPHATGKGAAVKCGMLAATGAVVAFTDADVPYHLDALRTGYDRITSRRTDVVFGARDIAGAENLAHRTILRTMSSAVFRGLVRLLISSEVTDTQAGLKIFSRRAARNIFTRVTLTGFAFDAEVITLTHRLGIPFERVPVTLINEETSTVSLRKHTLPMLRDLCWVSWKATQPLDEETRLALGSDLLEERFSRRTLAWLR